MARRIAVGIDLGTTNTVVSYISPDGENQVLRNSEGDTLTPSVVLFENDQVIVGAKARQAGSAVMDRTAECVKRDMGLAFYHRPIGDHRLPPEAIQAHILRKCHREIIQQLGAECDVVITVPAYFDEARRHATFDAGQISGLNVLDIVNEPTAAALAFGQSLGYLNPSGQAIAPIRVLVYDLGGGTFDVTIIRLEGKEFTTLATDGDVRLGGYDWDLRLANYAKQEFAMAYPGVAPLDEAADFDLRRQMEEVKHRLSDAQQTQISLAHAGQTLSLQINRQQFEDLTADLLERTAFTTRQTVRTADLAWSDIDRILLVGGSTRMPMVRKMLAALSGKSPEFVVHPDEAVARGAAISAYVKQLESASPSGPAFLRITNVASHSLGIEGIDESTLRKENFTLIAKNSPLPARVHREFVTKEDNQSNVLVRLLEGDSRQPEHCSELARARINHLPPGLPKGTKVRVDYSFDSSGRLSVEAAIPGVGREARMELQRVKALPNSQVQLWKKIVCQDGGYAAFENLDSLLKSPAITEELTPATTSVPTEAYATAGGRQPLSLEPKVPEGAPLAASQALKQAIHPSGNFALASSHSATRSHNRTHTAKWMRNAVGHVIFSLLGIAGGLYLLCLVRPELRAQLPDWLLILFGNP